MRPLDLRKETLTEKERRNIDILEILRKRGPISRPEISKEIGVNVVTISNYIDEYIKQNLVYEKEMDVSEGGRRPVLLDFNPHKGFVVGVGLNLMNMVGLLVDLKGNIVTKTQVSRPKASVREVSECSLEIVREILRRSKDYISEIRGVGVGISGLVNKNDGSVYWPQKVDNYYTYASVDVSMQELIEKEFNLPVLVENDATCACFGEHWLDAERNYKNLIYMYSGVGCGIMINGEIYGGTNGYAGEPSVYNYKADALFDCSMGKEVLGIPDSAKAGCMFKRCEADLGIIEDVKEMLAQDKKILKEFYDLVGSDNSNIDLKNIFVAARSKNPVALTALNTAAKKIGFKIALLVNLLNPQAVIIGGGLEEAGDDFLNRVNQTVHEWAFKESCEGLKILYSQLRENAVALGSASLVIQRVFAQV